MRWWSVLILVCTAPCFGELKPTTLEKPIYVQVSLREGAEKVSGSLIKFDHETLVIKTGGGERVLEWEKLTGASAFAVRAQVIDRKSAEAWLELAELAMQNDLKEQAKRAVGEALRIDPKSRLKGDAILRAQGAAKPTTKAVADAGGGTADGADVERYQKPTPEQEKAAMARFRKTSA